VTIRATGSGAYAGITLDKVFSLAKTRGGYEIVAALPTTNLFEGRVVYLTTLDGTNQPDKLYRYTGSAWTAAVPAVDISGTITETQIADNAISTGKLAANAVTAAKIAASTITATEIASNAVTADKINAGAVTSAKISVTSLSAITATIGTLRTASSGARVEIKDNLIEVYDASRLRVRIGVW
jgi:cytoskeletal protein RodZ